MQLAGGKWDHMMDQTHIGYTYWQEPPHNTMPRVDVIQLPVAADMGVAVVERDRAPERAAGPFAPRPQVLAPLDVYTQPTDHIDVYNRGRTPFAFTATAGERWLIVSPSHGTVDKEMRLSVSVDWTRAPAGERRVPITIAGPHDSRVTIDAPIFNPSAPRRDSVVGFVEGNGFVSMDAEHFTHAVAHDGVSWISVPDLGRTGSAMEATPITAASQAPGAAARLEYSAFLFDSGTVNVHAYLSPTLNFTNARTGLRYAVSFDDQPPRIIDAQADTSARAWEKSVADDIVVSISTHTLAAPGEHVLKFWMVDPGIVVQKLVIESRPLPPSYLGPPESYRRTPIRVVRSAAASTPRVP